MLHLDEPLAKPDQGLLDHLRQVAALGKAIADRLELAEDPRKRALLACWLHDVGKALQSFQVYMQAVRRLEEARSRGAPESEIEDLQRSVRQKKNQAYPHALAALVPTLVLEKHLLGEPFLATAAVVSHHSPLTESLYGHWERPPEDPENLIAFLEKLRPLLAEEGFPIPEETLQLMRQFLNFPPAGLLDDTRFGLRERFQTLPRWDFARVKAVLRLADWLASSGKSGAEEIFLSQGRNILKTYLAQKKFKLYQFQQETEKLAGENLALRAPTGAGKTEALLLWASSAERILYLLPTQATVNAMYTRLKRIFGPQNVGLAHGHASYILRQEKEDNLLWEKLSASVFAKPVTVATLDQFLLAGLQGRHWEEKLALSASAHIILDEIHSYEPYTLGLLAEMLADFPKKSLALASATLPKALLEIFSPEHLIEAEENFFWRKRHHVCLNSSSLKEALSEIISRARNGKKVLVISNTVREAQEIYRELGQAYDGPLHLFHSRFVFRDRLKKEALLEKPEPGTILVATQVVEVSLDISYDVLFTELAPLDALVQRLGRVNRRGKKPPAEVKIFFTVGEGSKRVYPEGVLEKSLSLLEELPEIPTEKDWVKAVNELYEEISKDEAFLRDFDLGRKTLREVREILGCYTIDLADEELRARFATRRGTPAVEVLPETFLAEAQALQAQKEGWRLVELLVPVPIWWLHAFKDWFYPSKDFGCFVTRLPYSPEEGLLPLKTSNEAPEHYEFW